MQLKTHLDAVATAVNELAALPAPNPLERDALIRGRVFLRALNQCQAAAQSTAAVIEQVNAEVDQINAAAVKPGN